MTINLRQDQETDVASGEKRADESLLLVEFLRDHDAFCPRCKYNVRNLTRPVCPECREPLSLRVDMLRLPLLWFVVTLMPSIFSGICGAMLLTILVIFPGEDLGPWLLDAFGLSSGIAGVVLFLMRDHFLRSPRRSQIAWAIITWMIHLTVFVMLLLTVQ
ncbi:MAG: hypothetical protein JSV91_05990 [Phycisphaerales bacterium]|nr:MAG: hypothetical protein JSV91_05990 [Phycisphaerales bacterium]